MLTNLTNRLIEDDVKRCEERLLLEGIVLPTQMSKIERYSLMAECSDINFDNVKVALCGVTFEPNETFEDRKRKLYNACIKSDVLTEGATETVKKLTMTKEDYKKLTDVIATYKKTKDEDEKKQCATKMKKFVAVIKASIDQADEKSPADAFVNSSISNIFKVVCGGKEIKAEKSSSKDILIAKITLINKSL